MTEYGETAEELVKLLYKICEGHFHENKEFKEYTAIQRSATLSRWFCRVILVLTMEQANQAIKLDRSRNEEGKISEYGADFFYSDEIFNWGQTKFSFDFGKLISREEIEIFANTWRHLNNCPSDASKEFQDAALELERKPTSPRIGYFVSTGTIEPGSQAEKAWKIMEEEFKDNPNIRFELYDINRILNSIGDPITPPITIKFNSNDDDKKSTILKNTDAVTGKTSIFGFVSAEYLKGITKKYKDSIFSRNPRLQKDDSKSVTFEPIKQTLEDPDKKQQFWKRNNGVTSICDDIKYLYDCPECGNQIQKLADGKGKCVNDSGCSEHDKSMELKDLILARFQIINMKIVNGRQTTYSFEEFDTKLTLDGVETMLSIHPTVDKAEGDDISGGTNTQNATGLIDLVSSRDELKKLERELAGLYKDQDGKPRFWFERQTNGVKNLAEDVHNRYTERRIMEKDSTIRGTYAFCISPDVLNIKEPELYGPDRTEFNKIFAQKTSDIVLAHCLGSLCKDQGQKLRKDVLTSGGKLQKQMKIEEITDEGDLKKYHDSKVIQKQVIINHCLRLIKLTLDKIDEKDRNAIEDVITAKFAKLTDKEMPSDEMLEIVQATYESFITGYDMGSGTAENPGTWPVVEVDGKMYLHQPDHKHIENYMKTHSVSVFPQILNFIDRIHKKTNPIRDALLALLP